MISQLPGDQNTDQKGRKLKWEEKEREDKRARGAPAIP